MRNGIIFNQLLTNVSTGSIFKDAAGYSFMEKNTIPSIAAAFDGRHPFTVAVTNRRIDMEIINPDFCCCFLQFLFATTFSKI